jgi:OOP family OmpA-OmpF porin
LDQVATSLIERPDVKVEIGGHTDSQGSEAYNLKLSNARADAVMQYLISKGVKADNLTAKGYGETMPIADNATDEGRTKNRRVELKRVM